MDAMRIQLQTKRRTYQKSRQPMAPGSTPLHPRPEPQAVMPTATRKSSPSSSQAPAPTAIPILSEWAQIGMAALLVLGGLAALRRRHTVRLIPRPRRPPLE